MALQLRDRPSAFGTVNESFFDMRILADLPDTAFEEAVAQAISAMSQIPLDPISNVSVSCGSEGPIISFVIETTGQSGHIEIQRVVTNNSINARARYSVNGQALVTTHIQETPSAGSDRYIVQSDPSLTKPLTQQEQEIAGLQLGAIKSIFGETSILRDVAVCAAQVQPVMMGEPGEDPQACVDACKEQRNFFAVAIAIGGLLSGSVSGVVDAATGGLTGMSRALRYGIKAVTGVIGGEDTLLTTLATLYIGDRYTRCTSCCNLGCGGNICIGKRKPQQTDPAFCSTACPDCNQPKTKR